MALLTITGGEWYRKHCHNQSVIRSAEAMIWVRLEKRNVSISLSPVHVSGHRRVTGGMINDTSHGSEGEYGVWGHRWGHHRHDHRLCMGRVDHHTHDQKLGDEAVLAARAAICVAQFMKQPNPQGNYKN